MNKYGTNPKTVEEVKICTYAICKNELDFLEDWVRNMWNDGKGSNYIVVLDTGSTDGTYERLKTIGNDFQIPEGHFLYSQVVVTPWRFDVARNMSLALCPKETLIDVMFCVDLDERVIPEFWSDLRNMVYQHPDFQRIQYRYSWSHNALGESTLDFWYDKIHGPLGWKWEFPVHETLTCCSTELYNGTDYYLNSNMIYLHHYPDSNKSRGSYLPLLKIRAEENPNDLTSNYYLAREYSFYQKWEECQKYSRIALGLFQENYDIYTFSAVTYLLATSLFELCQEQESIAILRSAIKKVKTRILYITLAQQLIYMGNVQECESTLLEMNELTRKESAWQIPAFVNADWKELQIRADLAAWKGDYKTAFELMSSAKQLIEQTADEHTAKNQYFYSDFEFINNHK